MPKFAVWVFFDDEDKTHQEMAEYFSLEDAWQAYNRAASQDFVSRVLLLTSLKEYTQ